MKIALVNQTGRESAMPQWLAANDLSSARLERWTIEPGVEVAEQILDQLQEQWQQSPVDIVIFPDGALGDELATRLAWRLEGSCVCQAQTLNLQERWVTKSHWGNALTATLQATASPLCLSLARQPAIKGAADFPADLPQQHLVPSAIPDWLTACESIEQVQAHPLTQAERVLVVGQGGEGADSVKIASIAQQLGAQAGYSRARVMNGGYDAERLIGISGHLLSPQICIVAGASGASALMAGVKDSRFIVAINQDASAPVFSQAEVGIVDDWLPVLEALAACAQD